MMTDQQIKDAIRDFRKAWTAGDTKQAITFLADDAVYVAPQGTFKGTTQIEKYIKWVNSMNKDYKAIETGIGIITQGDTGVVEINLSGIYKGMKWESPAVTIYQFKSDKISSMRIFYDTLFQAQQASKGIAKWMVNMVVNGSRKGLK